MSEPACPGAAQREALRRCEQEVVRRHAEAAEAEEMRRADVDEARREPERARDRRSARREANLAMVAIPAAVFEMGPPDEGPPTRVRLPAFFIDRYEVTAGSYALCVEAGVCRAPRGAAGCNFGRRDRSDHPMNCVSAEEARRYCVWRGARLPTEPEWDYAARGDDRREYAWGDDAPRGRAQWSGDCGGHGCAGGTAEVGSHPSDRSPFGLLDVTGNVREWVSDPMDYVGGEVTDPHGAPVTYVLRGGAWAIDRAVYLRCSGRDGPSADRSADGFRCALRR